MAKRSECASVRRRRPPADLRAVVDGEHHFVAARLLQRLNLVHNHRPVGCGAEHSGGSAEWHTQCGRPLANRPACMPALTKVDDGLGHCEGERPQPCSIAARASATARQVTCVRSLRAADRQGTGTAECRLDRARVELGCCSPSDQHERLWLPWQAFRHRGWQLITEEAADWYLARPRRAVGRQCAWRVPFTGAGVGDGPLREASCSGPLSGCKRSNLRRRRMRSWLVNVQLRPSRQDNCLSREHGEQTLRN